MQAVILAAGRGTRLGALTLNRSKAMLPVVGRPMVRRVLDRLACLPVREFILVASPEDREISAYFQEAAPLLASARGETPVRFAFQPERRGMADALRCAAPLIHEDFLLSACDNLAPAADLLRLLASWEAAPRPAAVLALLKMTPERIARSSAVLLDGDRVTRIVEKPAPGEAPSDMASLPLYIFTPAVLDRLETVRPSARGEYELQEAIQGLIDAGDRARGVLFSSRQTLTTAADLLAINRHYLAAVPDPLPGAPQPADEGARLIPPVFIEPGARLGAGCAIGPEVYLEGGCRIGKAARLERAVVLRGADVSPRAVICDQVVS